MTQKDQEKLNEFIIDFFRANDGNRINKYLYESFVNNLNTILIEIINNDNPIMGTTERNKERVTLLDTKDKEQIKSKEGKK